MKNYGDINIESGGEIINADIEHGIVDPITAGPGRLFYRTDLGAMRVSNGTTWSSIVMSVAATGSIGLVIVGSPITSSSTLTFTLGTELQGVSKLTTNGIVQRTSAGTYTSVALTLGQVTTALGFTPGQGTVTSVAASTSSFGLTITGSPITTTGTLTIALNSELQGLAGLVATGIIVRTGAGTYTSRTITGTASQLIVTNGTGVSGNPTIAIATDPIIPGTGAITISTGITAQRPVTPTVGMIRYNSSTLRYEAYNGTTWIPLQSMILQVATGTIATTTGTTTVPYDGTVPQSTEGFQIWTQSFTPILSTSRILINFSITTDNSAAGLAIIGSVFRGTQNLGSVIRSSDAGGTLLGATAGPGDLSISVVDAPGSISAITYSARVGGSAAGTTYINRSSAQTLGNAGQSYYTIMEVL